MKLECLSCIRAVCVAALVFALLARSHAGDLDLSFKVLDRYFRDPPNQYRMVQYVGHGFQEIPAEAMRDYGIGGAMLFLGSHQYLRSEEGWASMIANIALAKEAGLQVWVGDDNGYPSGTAGGLVVEADAAHEVRGLRQLTETGEGPKAIRMDLPDGAETFVHAALYPMRDGEVDLASGRPARVEDDHVAADGLDGPWLLAAFALEVIDEATQAMSTKVQFQTSGRYANLLSADAMAKFVDLTHAEYIRRLGSLKRKIDLFYTNEPNLMTLYFKGGERPGGQVFAPWDAALPERFRKTHGYDLMPRLSALFGGDSDEAKLTRRHFYQTVGDTMVDNFSGRIAQWTEENDVLSGGHLLLEEDMAMHVICQGDFLRVLSQQHVPGCDIPMPDEGSHWNYWMPKYVSSAAQLRGHVMVNALLDPIIGRREPLLHPTPEEFRRYINMAYLTGVNQISTYIPWQPYDPAVYRGLNEYAGRLGVMLRGATNATNIAMYYPIETFQARYVPTPESWPRIAARHRDLQESQDRTARSLLEAGYDFTYLNAEAILDAVLRKGELTLGKHAFTTVIMPGVELLPLAVLRRLEAFSQAGGTVLWVDALPELGDAPEEHAAVREAVAQSTCIAPEAVVAAMGPAYGKRFRLAFDAPDEGFFIGRYTRSGRDLYYIVNNTNAPSAPKLSGGRAVTVYDPMDGTATQHALPTTLDMEAYSGLIVAEKPR